MTKYNTRTIQLVLLALGALGWVSLSKSFQDDGKLDHEPNPLHLKRSPFGRTLALAMRGPVDVYWHRGGVHDHGEGHHEHGDTCGSCGSGCTHDPEEICLDHAACDHEHGEFCDHGHSHEEGSGTESLVATLEKLEEHAHEEPGDGPAPEAAEESTGVRSFLLDRIEDMRMAYYSRTNNKADSKYHKAYLMGEMQKRLAVSYEMDPSNLSGYGAYFLFLSEALARVEGRDDGRIVKVRRQAAHTLAHATLDYCLELKDEVTAMITAATAAHDCLQIVMESPEPDMKLASEYLRLLDGTLAQYEALRRKMIEDGTWERFPLNRRSEMEKAHSLVRVLRNLDHEMFGKLTNNTSVEEEESEDPPNS